MTEYDAYGTNAHTTSEVIRLVTDLLEVTFTERESDYRVLLLTATPSPDPALHRLLSSIEGLSHLEHEAS
ncbi:hypothetical protein [Streptomyces bluensis]|uniref:Uncharacterized protein n=1 Tax=Streptomyces bluensis TaxID=33897 RepID=A0ABW6UD69_9ACTN